MGANPLILLATAALTCWFVSITKSLTHGSNLSSTVASSINLENAI